MKAIVQERYGGPEVLRLADRETPVPNGDEVLVRVSAASLNARDWHLMRGDPYVARLMDPGSMGLRRPKVAVRGTDFAGVVESVGDGVRRLRPGNEVYGEAAGAFAEYVCAPEKLVAPKPARLSFEEAAAVPLAADTALSGLRDAGQVSGGQRVLVNGASGGVGTFAVQIGVHLGAEVTAVCSTRNVDLVRSLGAHRVVDYSREDFTRSGDRYDVVLDLVGNRSLSDYRRILHRESTLLLSGGGVSTGGSIVGPVALMVRAKLMGPLMPHRTVVVTQQPGQDRLAALRALVDSGALTPVIDRVYALAEVPEAMRYLETEHATAKVVIRV
jgi:NADPH:quinone reductase-like Zn-dependent oxidoreductase